MSYDFRFTRGAFRRSLLGGLLGVFAILEAKSTDSTVLMSPYEVVAESVEFKGWKKLRSPNFVVYTDASTKKVRPFLQQMEMMHMVAQVITGRRPLNHQPVHVVLPTSRSDWKKLQSKGGVDWKVAVSSENEFTYLCVVEYDWQEQGIYVMWASLAGIESTLLGIDWAFHLSKGFSFYFETMRPTDDGVKVGVGNPRINNLNHLGWLDWERFFAITGGSSEYRRSGSALQMFGGQAAVFMHYWLAQPPEQGLHKLLDWNTRLQAGREPTAEEFQKVFGMTFEELDDVMRDYVKKNRYVIRNYGIPTKMTDFVVTEIDVSAKEMRELFVLVQIKNQRIDDSKIALDSLLARGVETPHLRALLVAACHDWRRMDDALEVMQSMVAAGDEAAETWDGLATLTFVLEVGRPELETRISSALAERITGLVHGALARESLASGSNPVLAWTLALKEDVAPSDLDAIRAVCRKMDGNADTSNPLAALAVAAWRVGDEGLSRRLVDLLLASPYCDEHVIPLLEELSDRLG